MTDESTTINAVTDLHELAEQLDSAAKGAMPLSLRDAIVGSSTTAAVTDNQSGLSQKLSELRDSLIRQQMEEQFINSPSDIGQILPEQRTHPETIPSSKVSEPETSGRIAEQELSKSR